MDKKEWREEEDEWMKNDEGEEPDWDAKEAQHYKDVGNWQGNEKSRAIQRDMWNKTIKTKNIIISRHAGAIAWLKAHGITGEVMPQFVSPEPNVTYFGMLPMPQVAQILAVGSQFYLISLPAVAFGQRGSEMTPEEMDSAGAVLYRVSSIKLTRVI